MLQAPGQRFLSSDQQGSARKRASTTDPVKDEQTGRPRSGPDTLLLAEQHLMIDSRAAQSNAWKIYHSQRWTP